MSNLAPYIGGATASYQEPPRGRSSDAADLLRIWGAVRKRWRLFCAIALGVVVLVAAGTILAPKSYTTTVRMMAGRPSGDVSRAGPDTALPILNALVLENGEQSAETFAQLAQQRDLASKVITDLGLQTSPQALLGSVSVKPVVNTTLMNLTVTWKSPEKSAQIANAFAAAFVDQERDFVRSEAVAAIGFLSDELPQAEALMRSTASQLAKFQSTYGFIDAATHEQGVVTRITTIDQRLDELNVDQSEAQSLLKSVNAQLASLSTTVESAREVGPNPVSADLNGKLAAVETQLAEAEATYTSAHPEVIALRRQRGELLAQIAALPSSVISQTTMSANPLYQALQQQASTYRSRIQGDQGQLRALRAERAAYGPSLRAMPAQAMQFATLREDAARAANVYNALAQKYNDAVVAKATAISDVLIVQAASPDEAVRRPSLVTNVAVALAAGLLLALAVVYILELIEQRANDEDIARLIGLPVMARIPAFAPANPRVLPWIQSMTIEAFLHLCVALRLKNRRPLKTLAVMSTRRGDGKSTVAYNLAKAMATMQPRVLLIDADLRRPTLHEKANCANSVGLSDVLSGSATLENAVQEVGPALHILTSGASAENPVALLESRFEGILREAKLQYAMVIVDAPALAAVSDGLLIATHMDGTLLVVVAASDEKEARGSISQMAALGIDNILGIVVNKDAVRLNDYADYFAQSTGGVPLTGDAR